MIVKRAALIGIVLAPLFVSAAARPADDEQDRKNVRLVFDKYVQSVKTADVALASEIWAHSDDIDVVTPFGRFQGWNSVRDNLYVNFLQKMFSERDLRPTNVAIHVAGDAAWLVFDWEFSGKFPNGQSIASKGWESHIYQRTAKGWTVVQLHYSVPPPPQ